MSVDLIDRQAVLDAIQRRREDGETDLRQIRSDVESLPAAGVVTNLAAQILAESENTRRAAESTAYIDAQNALAEGQLAFADGWKRLPDLMAEGLKAMAKAAAPPAAAPEPVDPPGSWGWAVLRLMDHQDIDGLYGNVHATPEKAARYAANLRGQDVGSGHFRYVIVQLVEPGPDQPGGA